MADTFTVVSSAPDVALLGLDQIVDVQQTMVQATGSGVIFPVRVPSTGDIAGPTGQLAASMAAAFDSAAQVPGIASMAVTQDIDAAGNLIDVVILIVTSTNGLITAEKTVPLASFGQSSLVASGVGGFGTLGAGDGLQFEVIPTLGGGAGGSLSTFNLEAFSSRVTTWRADLDALANL